MLKQASKLAGTKIGISRDFPDAIRKARDKLQPARKQAKQDEKKTMVLFPAKLLVDGVVVQVDMPDWHQILNADTDPVRFPDMDTH